MIGVFDSGLGGLTVLRALVARFPNLPFIYLCDHAHVPYGDRASPEIIELTRQGVEALFAGEVLLALGDAAPEALGLVAGAAFLGIQRIAFQYQPVQRRGAFGFALAQRRQGLGGMGLAGGGGGGAVGGLRDRVRGRRLGSGPVPRHADARAR